MEEWNNHREQIFSAEIMKHYANKEEMHFMNGGRKSSSKALWAVEHYEILSSFKTQE